MHGDLRAVMKELGLYSMEDGTLAAGEMDAYDAAISLMDAWYTRLLTELYPDTAEEQGLRLWEQALALRGDGKTIPQRRNAIWEQERLRPGEFDNSGFLRKLEQASSEAALSAAGKVLTVSGINRTDLSELGRVAQVLLPNLSPMAELSLEGTGKSWSEWEALSHNWNLFDRTGLPWAFYDTI